MSQEHEFDQWIKQVSDEAGANGVSIKDREFWRDTFDAGLMPKDAFYYIYPECLPGDSEG